MIRAVTAKRSNMGPVEDLHWMHEAVFLQL